MNSMEKWKGMQGSQNSELGEVEIKWGIFPGYSLSPLVLVCFSTDSIKLDFKKDEGSIWVFRMPRKD